MALSTTIPSTTISPAKVMVLSGIPHKYITPTEQKVERGTMAPATNAVRHGKRMSITRMMIIIDSNRFFKKSFTERSTTWLWSVMHWMVTSSGNEDSM